MTRAWPQILFPQSALPMQGPPFSVVTPSNLNFQRQNWQQKLELREPKTVYGRAYDTNVHRSVYGVVQPGARDHVRDCMAYEYFRLT